MSVHYVPTNVLGAKYKREQSNAIHALCQSAFKIVIQFLSSLHFWYGEKCAEEAQYFLPNSKHSYDKKFFKMFSEST